MELYNDPANTFVAGFIGSPQMNFLKASAIGLQGETISIRPEYLQISEKSGEISGTISHIEHLDGETNIYVNTDPHCLLTVRLFGEHDYAIDAFVQLTLDPNGRFHFDASGERIR